MLNTNCYDMQFLAAVKTIACEMERLTEKLETQNQLLADMLAKPMNTLGGEKVEGGAK